MRPNIESVTGHIAAIRARLRDAPDEMPLQEVEDALCDGYALGLTVDAWLTERGERLQELLDDPSTTFSARDLREIASDNAYARRTVADLRDELETLRHERDRLLAHAQARSDAA